LLLQGVYSKPHGKGVNEGNLWGDYFYLEALMRLAKPDWKPYW
jgi:unsaturated chondroitin disaccharide hydrolase